MSIKKFGLLTATSICALMISGTDAKACSTVPGKPDPCMTLDTSVTISTDNILPEVKPIIGPMPVTINPDTIPEVKPIIGPMPVTINPITIGGQVDAQLNNLETQIENQAEEEVKQLLAQATGLSPEQLNQLEDGDYQALAETYLGFTQEELEDELLNNLAESMGVDVEDLLSSDIVNLDEAGLEELFGDSFEELTGMDSEALDDLMGEDLSEMLGVDTEDLDFDLDELSDEDFGEALDGLEETDLSDADFDNIDEDAFDEYSEDDSGDGSDDGSDSDSSEKWKIM